MLNRIIEIFKINENKYCNTEFRYTYFTDSDLIDDTYYIYNLLFKRNSEDTRD